MLLILLGSVSGAAWGLLGYWIAGDTGVRNVAWVGLLASPAIGVVISLIVARFSPDSFAGQLGLSLLTLYLAVALFCVSLIVAADDPWSDLHRDIVSGTLTGLIWLTLSGGVLILWPLSFVNNLIILARPHHP